MVTCPSPLWAPSPPPAEAIEGLPAAGAEAQSRERPPQRVAYVEELDRTISIASWWCLGIVCQRMGLRYLIRYAVPANMPKVFPGRLLHIVLAVRLPVMPRNAP